jgi:Zn-finger nucleic acid-binding protein
MPYNQKMEAYFHSKDREIIESRKIEELEKLHEEIEKATAPDSSTCSSCRGEVISKEMDSINYDICTSCYNVTLSMENVEKLYKEQKISKFKFTVLKFKERSKLLKSFEDRQAG